MSERSIAAVIFDRDGVLTDFDLASANRGILPLLPVASVSELTDHWRIFKRRGGGPRSLAEEQLFWQGFWNYLADFYSLSDSLREQLHRINYTNYLKPFADARPALAEAKRRGLRTAVLSNFELASLEDSLNAVGLAELVDLACAATVIGASKPDPQAYWHVLNTLGVAAEQALFFDDLPGCVRGARACGLQAYLVDRGASAHRLADGVVCDLSALTAILEGAGINSSL